MAVFYPQCRGVMQVVFDGFGGDDTAPQIVHFIPRSATVHLNGYRQADTFAIDFDAAKFPFSPELIRSAAVQLHVFATDGIVTDPATLDRYATDEHLVIAGLVDEATLRYSGEGRSFQASGRDYTSLLLGKQWPPDKRIPGGGSLVDAVQALVDEATNRGTGRTLTVRYQPAGGTPPIVGQGLARWRQHGRSAKHGKNYWDVIYQVCIEHGHVAFVRGLDVIVARPQALTQESADRAVRMAWGRNLRHLEVERHLGQKTVPQIIATSYDRSNRVLLTAKWPPDGARATRNTAIGTPKEEIERVIAPPGITEQGLLNEYAKAYYHNLSRAEATVKFETKDLADLDGRDLLRLRAGDPVQIGFDAFNADEMRQLSAAQRERRLHELGYDDDVARLVAQEFDHIHQFQRPFYTRDVALSWSVNDGLTVGVEAINYIAPSRDDVR